MAELKYIVVGSWPGDNMLGVTRRYWDQPDGDPRLWLSPYKLGMTMKEPAALFTLDQCSTLILRLAQYKDLTGSTWAKYTDFAVMG